jgi:hypothetical protein
MYNVIAARPNPFIPRAKNLIRTVNGVKCAKFLVQFGASERRSLI